MPYRAQVMTAIDPLPAAGADKDILVVIGHPDHLMGHHLADGEDEIRTVFNQQFIHLGRPGIVDPAFGDIV